MKYDEQRLKSFWSFFIWSLNLSLFIPPFYDLSTQPSEIEVSESFFSLLDFVKFLYLKYLDI